MEEVEVVEDDVELVLVVVEVVVDEEVEEVVVVVEVVVEVVVVELVVVEVVVLELVEVELVVLELVVVELVVLEVVVLEVVEELVELEVEVQLNAVSIIKTDVAMLRHFVDDHPGSCGGRS